MREKRSLMIFFMSLAILIGGSFVKGITPLQAAEPMKSDTLAPQATDVGYLENIILENPSPGKERLVVSVSRLAGAQVENQPKNALLVKLDNTFVPQDFRRPIGEGALRNIIRVVPVQKVLDGRPWAYLAIDLKERVPHSVRQEGQNIIVEFNVASLTDKATAKAPPPPAEAKPAVALGDRKEMNGANGRAAPGPEPVSERGNYGGRKISLDFQDANIKSVLRLLSELAEVNIVSGEDVKGTVTFQMKNVPWDQALDTILSITGLARKQEGNVITVMTLEKMRKDDSDRQVALEAKRKLEMDQARPVEPLVTRVISINYTDAPKLTSNLLDLLKDKDGKVQGSVKVDDHSNSLIIQATRQDMTRLLPIIEKIDKPIPQILIKAHIVETTKDTARDLGIQWGGINGQKVGNQSLFVTPGGTGGVATAPGGPFAGTFTPTAGGPKGIAGQGFGVNFPATSMSGTASASLGLLFGTIGENILEVQLNALQKDGKVNILSSPSITTLDNQKAFTENGEKVPYVTSEASGGLLVRTVKFENAVLRLEITPHVIDGKNLKMKILVQKDEVAAGGRNVDGNPIITKKQTETNLIVEDGETIVISGLTKESKTENVNGVPWLKDVPVLGWLFKGESKTDIMEEVLIFITPNIVKTEVVAGIQEGT